MASSIPPHPTTTILTRTRTHDNPNNEKQPFSIFRTIVGLISTLRNKLSSLIFDKDASKTSAQQVDKLFNKVITTCLDDRPSAQNEAIKLMVPMLAREKSIPKHIRQAIKQSANTKTILRYKNELYSACKKPTSHPIRTKNIELLALCLDLEQQFNTQKAETKQRYKQYDKKQQAYKKKIAKLQDLPSELDFTASSLPFVEFALDIIAIPEECKQLYAEIELGNASLTHLKETMQELTNGHINKSPKEVADKLSEKPNTYTSLKQNLEDSIYNSQSTFYLCRLLESTLSKRSDALFSVLDSTDIFNTKEHLDRWMSLEIHRNPTMSTDKIAEMLKSKYISFADKVNSTTLKYTKKALLLNGITELTIDNFVNYDRNKEINEIFGDDNKLKTSIENMKMQLAQSPGVDK